MNQKSEQFLTYLKEQQEQTNVQALALIQEERSDEASFLKAKANIYDIFATLFSVSEKQSAGDEEMLKEEFLKKAENVPQNWMKSLKLAKAHNDAAKIVMEETKLEAAEDIMKKYRELWEV